MKSLWVNIFTAMLLALPVLGLWMLIDALYHGPNYFGSRVVVLERLESSTSSSRSGRFGVTEVQTVWRLDYHYTDRNGQVRRGQKRFKQADFPPSAKKPGDQLFTKIAVDKEEGGFGLNLRAEQGLSLILIIGLMGLWPIGSIRWREN